MGKLRITLIGIFIFLAFTASYAADYKPQIKILTPDAEIGEVKKGKVIDYAIEVQNAGTADLEITNVYSGCGCVSVVDERWKATSRDMTAKSPVPFIVRPAGHTFIKVQVDTNKITGSFEKLVHIFSNDPEHVDVVWKAKGVVLDSAPKAGSEDRSNSIGIGSEPHAGDAAGQGASKYPLSGRVEQSSESKVEKMVLVFYSPGCSECRKVMEEILPKFKQEYGGKILIVEYNIDNPESLAFFIDLENKYDERSKKGFFNPKPPAVFIEGKFLYGIKEIEEKLEKLME